MKFKELDSYPGSDVVEYCLQYILPSAYHMFYYLKEHQNNEGKWLWNRSTSTTQFGLLEPIDQLCLDHDSGINQKIHVVHVKK